MGSYHSNIHPGDAVRVRDILSVYHDDKDFSYLLGKEGIVTPVGGVQLEENEHIVSFINDEGREVLAVFTDGELELVRTGAVHKTSWMESVMQHFKRR